MRAHAGYGLLAALALAWSPPPPAAGAVSPFGSTAQGSADVQALWERGRPFAEFLEAASSRREAWHGNYGRATPAEAEVDRARALPGGYRLLVVAEDWCGDSVNTIPYLARLAEQVEGLDLRVVDSETGEALMARHRTPDDRAATPTVVVLDPSGGEVGAWVERPSELQEWFLETRGTVPRRELYDRKYAWYDEDAGASTVREIVDLLEQAARNEGEADHEWAPLRLVALPSPTEALLQAVSPVNERVVWVSGHEATWARSLDGGDTWSSGTVPGAEGLQFRDIHAHDADTAWLLSAGSGEASRIYRTDDGGASWALQFLNSEPEAFFDCFAFWDERRGLAFSDSVGGRFVILTTDDGGASWRRVPAHAMPDARLGEGGFAASGTCTIVGDGGRAWIGTGAADNARVLLSADWGASWRAADTPVVAHASAGIASLVQTGPDTLLALGGDIGTPSAPVNGVARSSDGGRSWTPVGRASGAVYGAAHRPGTDMLLAVGPAGIDLSTDLGDTWRRIDERAHWAVAFASARRGWAVGPGGRIQRIEPS